MPATASSGSAPPKDRRRETAHSHEDNCELDGIVGALESLDVMCGVAIVEQPELVRHEPRGYEDED